MSETPTPGQVCYAAWHAIIIPTMFPDYTEDWSQVSHTEQRAWEAAAQAVHMPLLEEERQLVLMALAHLAVARPGWEAALNSISQKMHGADLSQHFLTLAQEDRR